MSAMGMETGAGFHRKAVRLSYREVEVLRLIAEGMGSREVADILFLSKRTVDFHLANTYHKFGVNNKMLAIRAASRFGILPIERTYRR